jgi:oligopeptide/dipeptide ABC transporter ATP-binding protein
VVRRGPLARGRVRLKAVDGVSFSIQQGVTFGLVGESGCGKTTVGRTLVRLYKPTSGRILFRHGAEYTDLAGLSGAGLKPVRRQMQIIYQDPYSSLNPRMTVGRLIQEPLVVHGVGTRRERRQRAAEMLEAVGLQADHLKRYPHEFSGGQRQRIAIARALALRPLLVVADEPVSSLDVSIQAQVLNLLEDLQKSFNLTYLFIAHDLSVVKHISGRIAVMYLGRIVEAAPTESLFRRPRHPYTEALMSAIPLPDPDLKMKRIILEGDVPNPIDPPTGCRFHPRCRYAEARCRSEEPRLRDLGGGHEAACHLAESLALSPWAGGRAE